MPRARKSVNATGCVSPACSSNRRWLANHHPASFIARPGGDDDADYGGEGDDGGGRERYCSGYGSNIGNTSSEFLSATEGDFRCGSSLAGCNAWSLGRSSIVDEHPTTPSPFCSPLSSSSCSPPSDSNQVSTEEIEQEAMKGIKMGGSTNRRNCSNLKRVEAVRRAGPDENSMATSNYFADDDRLPAVLEVQEDDGSFSEHEASDIESVIEGRIGSKEPSKFADKLSTWKYRTAKIMDRLKREEAAIDDWEKKKATKAKMDLKELEMKFETKRERAVHNLQKKLLIAQKEARIKKAKARAAAIKKIARVEEVFKKKTANPGNWFHRVLKIC